MGCFPASFQEVKRPLRTKSGKRPIKVGKRPIKEGKRPIKAMVLVGISVGCLMGCFRAPPPWRKTAPLKRPIKRSMTIELSISNRFCCEFGSQRIWFRSQRWKNGLLNLTISQGWTTSRVGTLIAWYDARFWDIPQSIGEGASSLLGQRPGSPEDVSCSSRVFGKGVSKKEKVVRALCSQGCSLLPPQIRGTPQGTSAWDAFSETPSPNTLRV